jgi:hypothetical protein
MQKTLALALITALLAITSARAQVNLRTISPASGAFGVEAVTRITSIFRTTVAAADPQTVPDAKAQDAARRVLYQMGEGECAALSEIFHAECRLSSLNINIWPLGPSAQNAAQNNSVMTATAVYELRLRGQSETPP